MSHHDLLDYEIKYNSVFFPIDQQALGLHLMNSNEKLSFANQYIVFTLCYESVQQSNVRKFK